MSEAKKPSKGLKKAVKTSPETSPEVQDPLPPPKEAPRDFIKAPSSSASAPSGSLEGLPMASLIALRDEIDRLVPSAELKDINLESELVRQYQQVKALQLAVIADKDTPVNQKAQVANSCAATLGQLTKMQSDFYTSERFKAIESILIKCLKGMPEDMVVEFFKEYEALNT